MGRTDMSRVITLFVIIIAIIFAAGCRGGIHSDVYVEDDHHHDHEPEPEDFYPWLLAYGVVDSYGYSTFDNPDFIPELDPYIDDGYFEVEWEVDAVRDYIVEYRINDVPDVNGSRLIDAELCGVGLSCDEVGYQFCQYTPDFTLACDVSYQAYEGVNSSLDPLDISDMVFDLPETLYLVVQICDTESSYCEFDAMPVLLY